METHREHFRRLGKGIVLILIAWFLFSLVFFIAKITSDEASIPQIIFFRNIFAFLFCIPWMIKDFPNGLKTSRFGLVFARSISGLLGMAFIFLALTKISLVDATLLNNTSPLIIPFVIAIYLKKPIQHKLWPALIIGFVGIILILKPSGKNFFDWGNLYALLSAVMISISTLLVRLARTEPFHTVLFYYFFIGLVCTLPFSLYYWNPLSLQTYLLLFILSIFSFFGQLAFFKAFHYGKAAHLSSFSYSAVVFAAILEWLFWHQVPDFLATLGIICVCIGGIFVTLWSKPSESLPSPK